MNVMALLKKRADSAADLRIKTAELEAALPGLRADLVSAQAKRSELLLSGSDAAVLKAEADITTARLAVDRCEAVIAETTRLAALADTAERIAAIKARSAELDAAAARSAARVRKAFDTAAAELAAALQECFELDEVIVDHNREVYGSEALPEQDRSGLQIAKVNDRLVKASSPGTRATLWRHVDLPQFGKCPGFGTDPTVIEQA